MKALIIHNNTAGFGSDSIFEFSRQLLEAGDECSIRIVGGDFNSDEALQDAERFDVVIISGGDGTVSRALYALRGRGVKSCIFPSGTANLIATNIGTSIEPSVLARACKSGITAKLDLGEINWTDVAGTSHTCGLNLMGGIGFDANLMNSALLNKPVLGEAAYFAAALENARPEIATFTITVDGVEYTCQGIGCIVANTAMIQGDIELVPNCRMDDGMLDLIVLETKDATQLLRPMFFGIFDRKGNKLGRPHLTSFKGSTIRVTCSKTLPIEIDGEVFTYGTSSFEVHACKAVSNIIVDAMSPYYPA